MIPKIFRTFISDLIAATENGKVKWRELDSSTFSCDHKNHTLHLSSYFDEDRAVSMIFFRFVTDEKVTPFSVRDDEDGTDYQVMTQLLQVVAANANDVSTDIENFFD